MPTTRFDQPRVQRRTVVLLSLAQIFGGVSIGAILATGSLLAVELSGSDLWAGSVTTALTLGTAVAAAVLLRVAAARGRRPSLSLAFAIATLGAAGVILASVTQAFWLLLLSGALVGFGGAAGLQMRFAATDLSDSRHRGRDLSVVVWMSTVGSVAGPNLLPVGEWIEGVLGIPPLSGLYVLAVIGLLLSMAIIWIGLRPDPYVAAKQLRTRDQAAGSKVDAQTDSTSSSQGPDKQSLSAGIRSLWSRPKSRSAILKLLVTQAIMISIMAMTPVHLTNHAASITLVGFAVSLHIAGMYAFSPIVGILSDRFGGHAVSSVGMVLLAAASAFAAFGGGSHLMASIALVLLGLGWSAGSIGTSAQIIAVTPPDELLGAQGASDALMSLAGAVGGLVAGFVMALTSYSGLGIAAGVLAVGTITLSHLIHRSAPTGSSTSARGAA